MVSSTPADFPSDHSCGIDQYWPVLWLGAGWVKSDYRQAIRLAPISRNGKSEPSCRFRFRGGDQAATVTATAMIQSLAGWGTTAEIKQNPTREKLHAFDLLRDWRRVATRCDKRAWNLAATVIAAAIVRWWI
jgi:hypothetical protein